MDRISIRVFDKNINFLGEVDEYTSLFYIRKWNTHGEFEFHLSSIDPNIIKIGNIVMLGKDKAKSGVIEYVEINQENHKEIIVKGFGLSYWLSQRVTVPPINAAQDYYNTNAEDIILNLVKNNAILPTDRNRIIPYLEIEKSKGRGELIEFQTRYKNLADELSKIAKASSLGFNIDLDYKNKKFIFRVLEGRNLTSSQRVNPPAIFSLDYDNIKKQNYVESTIGYKNCGYIAGEGEGEERDIEVIYNELSGLERREIFIDAGDVKEGGNLIDAGKIKLAENPKIASFECEVDPNAYKTNWDLGDVVTTIDKKHKIVINNRVLEVTEVYETNNFKVEPRFGEAIPSVNEKIKQITDVPLKENKKKSQEPTGAIDKTFICTQLSPSKLWRINHNLNKMPSVSVADSSGTVLMGDIRYIDSNNLELIFTTEVSGSAYFN
ncbi:virus ReqiPepy6 Gp37-like protein [Clostridium collagenovorans DSM 3089]|uniref:Virus ReqiPepy6 Gp37-like protein n=1 Tax=Clostridium collagenovorans DSM 3089 TaxID=1121306 RepID=A0A1M5XP56_9CLOT|nr:siphovirus ReqiPepy6 Gp37-like family protein [Clostridium collagenovorans]SHI01328.1 virus ReqiPepy6 Gp37-like protein [Clostridium collagenovorans DSM 3089]